MISLPKQPANFWRQLLIIALPTSIQAMLFSGLAVADTMMVGVLGEAAVAAVGLGNKLHFVALLLTFGFANTCSILVAQYFGAEQFHKIQRALVLTLVFACLCMIPIALLFATTPSIWIKYLAADPELIQQTATYLKITSPIVILISIVTSTEYAMRAMGETMMSLILGIMTVLVNVVLNYVFIYGNWGAPALGVAGAALATLLARVFQTLIFFGFLYACRHTLMPTNLNSIRSYFKFETIKKYFNFAIPVTLTFGLWGLGSTIYHLIVSRMGKEPLAVFSMLAPIENLIISTFVGLSAAASVMLGRELGANRFDRAWQLRGYFVYGTTVIAMIFSLILWLCGPWVLAPFQHLEPSTVQSLNTAYTVMCALIWMKVHNMLGIVAVLRAGGDNQWCLKMDFTAMWLVGLPLTFFTALYLDWPFHWVYIVIFIEEILKVIGTTWRIYQRKWMNNLTNSLGDEPH